MAKPLNYVALRYMFTTALPNEFEVYWVESDPYQNFPTVGAWLSKRLQRAVGVVAQYKLPLALSISRCTTSIEGNA